MFKFLFILLPLTLALTFTVNAEAAASTTATTPTVSTQTPTTQLMQLLNQYQSLTAHFNQGVYDANGTLVQMSHGTMAIMRPNNFRWYTLQPTEQLIITNGKQLWIYDLDLQQVTLSKLQKKTGTTPAMLMTSSTAEMQQFYRVSVYPAPANEQVFQLLPKVKNADFVWVRFFFENKQLHKMQIKDNIGQVTSITFSQLKVNSVLPKSLFTLNIPKGTDVIRE